MCSFKKWLNASRCLHFWGNILEFQKKWVEALQIYILAFAFDFKHNKEWLGLAIKNLGRVHKALGESPFKARWRDLTGKDCPEEWLKAIRIAREYQEE
jgi:hypothetical protein